MVTAIDSRSRGGRIKMRRHILGFARNMTCLTLNKLQSVMVGCKNKLLKASIVIITCCCNEACKYSWKGTHYDNVWSVIQCKGYNSNLVVTGIDSRTRGRRIKKHHHTLDFAPNTTCQTLNKLQSVLVVCNNKLLKASIVIITCC